MDFTYVVALFLSAITGIVCSLGFVAMRGRSYWRLAISILLTTLAIDVALLLDWSRVDEFTARFLLTDLAFFAGCGLVGGLIGALPVLGLRAAFRYLTPPRVG